MTLVERFATAPMTAIQKKADPKFSRAAARSAAHWAIAVVYQRTTGRVLNRGTSAEAMEELMRAARTQPVLCSCPKLHVGPCREVRS